MYSQEGRRPRIEARFITSSMKRPSFPLFRLTPNPNTMHETTCKHAMQLKDANMQCNMNNLTRLMACTMLMHTYSKQGNTSMQQYEQQLAYTMQMDMAYTTQRTTWHTQCSMDLNQNGLTSVMPKSVAITPGLRHQKARHTRTHIGPHARQQEHNP